MLHFLQALQVGCIRCQSSSRWILSLTRARFLSFRKTINLCAMPSAAITPNVHLSIYDATMVAPHLPNYPVEAPASPYRMYADWMYGSNFATRCACGVFRLPYRYSFEYSGPGLKTPRPPRVIFRRPCTLVLV